jgi:phosphopantothenoylcysteine decarboxylase/phosphopantothenate--cysteine ligase
VVLVAGPTQQPTPAGVERIDVLSAADMRDAVMSAVERADIFIGAAAVADYRPVQVAPNKIKKQSEQLTLTLERTADILQTVAAMPTPPYTVGFAAETDDLPRYARDKLVRKKLDMIAANWVGGETGFESEDNALEVFWQNGQASLARQGKDALAQQLVRLIAERYHAKHST